MSSFFQKTYKAFSGQQGFTLVELLVTLVITSVVMSAVIVVYSANLHSAKAEDQRVDLQQSHRFSMDLLLANLRHAGYDKWENGAASIVAAGEDYIYFTADFQGCLENRTPAECADPLDPKLDPNGPFPDGEIDDNGEHIVFCRYTVNGQDFLGYVNSSDPAVGASIDTDNDGFSDPGHTHGPDSHQPVVGIDGLEFLYTLSTGGPTTYPSTPIELERIRSVQIGLLARSNDVDIKFSHPANITYARPTGGNWTGFNDNFRRRLLTAQVRLRNMGLE